MVAMPVAAPTSSSPKTTRGHCSRGIAGKRGATMGYSTHESAATSAAFIRGGKAPLLKNGANRKSPDKRTPMNKNPLIML